MPDKSLFLCGYGLIGGSGCRCSLTWRNIALKLNKTLLMLTGFIKFWKWNHWSKDGWIVLLVK